MNHSAKKEILIVEDDESTGEVLTLVISQETPYHSILVKSGQEALQLVQQRRPHLLILDYRLPDLTGLEIYDRIQMIETCKDIPTILLSATHPSEDIESLNILLMEKPFELDTLLEAITNLLKS